MNKTKVFCTKCQCCVYMVRTRGKQTHPVLGNGCQYVKQGDVPHVRCRCGQLIVILKAAE